MPRPRLPIVVGNMTLGSRILVIDPSMEPETVGGVLFVALVSVSIGLSPLG
jgi:hypothetical protein